MFVMDLNPKWKDSFHPNETNKLTIAGTIVKYSFRNLVL
jgi:hypothetical protein